MAPDINAMAEWATDGYANNGVPRADYEIPGEFLAGLNSLLMADPVIVSGRLCSSSEECTLLPLMNSY
jgi:hypothetical protein